MKNYLQIEVNGQKVGLKFVYESIKAFSIASADKEKEAKYWIKNETDGVENSSFTTAGFAKLIQCSYEANCFVKEVEPTLTYEDFYDFVEEAQETEEGIKLIGLISQTYSDSTYMKKLVSDNEKKNQVSL